MGTTVEEAVAKERARWEKALFFYCEGVQCRICLQWENIYRWHTDNCPLRAMELEEKQTNEQKR